jgi:hypothetical protein
VKAGRERGTAGLARRCGPVVLCALAVGCVEERIVNYRPMLGGLPGAESGTPVTGVPGRTMDPAAVPDDKLVIENKDGSKTLIARTGRHLMVHIHNTLAAGDEQLFLDQVLSKRTKEEYYDRGMDPREAYRTLRERRQDIDMLFDAMPMGEYTPGFFLRPVGGGVQRLEVQGPGARELTWTGFDMVMENGNFRLRWFVTPE